MKIRSILVAGVSTALALTPVAMAKNGGDDDKGRDRDKAPIGATTPAAGSPATVPTIAPVACAPSTGALVNYEIRGRVLAVSASAIIVKVAKANGNFRAAVKAERTFGQYDPAPGASDLATVTIGQCTKVSGLRVYKSHSRGKRKGSLDAANCVLIGHGTKRSAKKSGAICVGNRIKVKWRAAANADVAAGALGAPRKVEVQR